MLNYSYIIKFLQLLSNEKLIWKRKGKKNAILISSENTYLDEEIERDRRWTESSGRKGL